jgi:23S rRNA pseudouridine2605 synthase
MSDQRASGRDTPGGKAKPPSGKRHPGERIAKAMARAGLCSRRDAEAWIAAGRVSVNGQALTSPAFNVTESDDIRVDGAPLARRERTRLFLFHKPRGLVTTARDPEGRRTIFEALPEGAPRLVAVGRLDINTEGLLLLTNDGGLARVLELPATGWLRRYRVRAHGAIDQAALDPLADGVTIDGVDYAGIEAKLDRAQGSNVWLTMGLREGKNREIKRVLEHLGLTVNRLIRVSFGPFQLGELEEGGLAETPTRVLREQIGPRLARESGADFDAPLREVRRVNDRERPSREPRRVSERERPSREGKDAPQRSGARRDDHRGGRVAAGSRFEERDGAPRREARPERKRKYFAALRDEREDAGRGPRRRIERGATSDRKGREIAVERVKPAQEPKSRDKASGPRRSPPTQRRSREEFPHGDKRKRSRGAPPQESKSRDETGGPRRSPPAQRRSREEFPQGDKRKGPRVAPPHRGPRPGGPRPPRRG